MSSTYERLPFAHFLEVTECRSGEPLELAAMAELAGYSDGDALQAGWPSILAAAQATDVKTPDSGGRDPFLDLETIQRAFIRGLTYTGPVVAMWALFPKSIDRTVMTYLAAIVILSWGGSLALTYVTGMTVLANEQAAWRRAALFATLATVMVATIGAGLYVADIITVRVALVGFLQALYFFCASPLMLRSKYAFLATTAVLGAAAGAFSLFSSSPGWAGAARVVTAACLAAPAFELRRLAVTPGEVTEQNVRPDHRDVLSYALYGIAFGLLVLWPSVANATSPTARISLIIICGLAISETAVAYARRRGAKLLAVSYHAPSFVTGTRRVIWRALALYLVPVALSILLICTRMAQTGTELQVVIPAGVTVLGLGAVQILSLLCLALHGIRMAAGTLSFFVVVLLGATPLASVGPSRTALYLAIICGLVISLTLAVRLLSQRPVNYL